MCRPSPLSYSELSWPEEANPPKAQGQTRWYTSGGDGWSTSGDHGWYRSGDHGWYTQADYAWSSVGRSVTPESTPVAFSNGGAARLPHCAMRPGLESTPGGIAPPYSRK